MTGPGGELFEYWGHAASLVPIVHQPLLRWRMAEFAAATRTTDVGTGTGAAWQLEHADYLDADPRRGARPRPARRRRSCPIRAAATASGGTGAASGARRMEMPVRRRAGSAGWRHRNFERIYDLPERVHPGRRCSPRRRRPIDEAHRQLLLLAAAAHGVGTVRDLADYFRIKHRGRPRPASPSWSRRASSTRSRSRGGRSPATCSPGARPRRAAPRRTPRCCRRSTR